MAILALVPVEVEYALDACYHGDLIGSGGKGLQEITAQFPIKVVVPKRSDEEAENIGTCNHISRNFYLT